MYVVILLSKYYVLQIKNKHFTLIFIEQSQTCPSIDELRASLPKRSGVSKAIEDAYMCMSVYWYPTFYWYLTKIMFWYSSNFILYFRFNPHLYIF